MPFEESSATATVEKSVDRKLGDEWVDWDGTLQQNNTRISAWVFLALSAVTSVLYSVLWLGFIWLIHPRLLGLGLGAVSFCLAGMGSAYVMLWYGCLLIGAQGIRIAQVGVKWLGGIRWSVAGTIVLGKLLGLSRDRVGHAYILIHNRLEKLAPLISDPAGLLMLLPRCINRETLQALRELKQTYGFAQVIATGGTEARKAIAEHRPLGILAVACERDLLVGIKDLHGRIPVLAFTNIRPEGPCKNTRVDLGAIEQAVRLFLGQRNTK